MNAYTETHDPATSYMSPSTSANFDIEMNLSQEGIGAVLRSDNEYTFIQRTIPGGPATKRGLVVGLPTFGRGSVQTLLDLNRDVPDEQQDIGRLRLTMAMFYRVNGDSVQLRGIEPDIVFPFDSPALPRERLQANPLPWDRISPVSTLTYGFHLEPGVFNRHFERARADRGFELMAERNRRLAALDTQKMASLKLADRQAKAKEDDAMARQLKSESAGVDMENGTDLGSLRESAQILADCIRAGCFRK